MLNHDFLSPRIWLVRSIALWLPCLAVAATTQPEIGLAAVHEVESVVDKVVLYRNVASIEQFAELELEPGTHEVVFAGIPADEVSVEAIRASVQAPWQVLGVDTSVRSVGDELSDRPEVEALRIAREGLRRIQLKKTGVEADLVLLGMVGVRAASDAAGHAGTASLDLDSLRAQFEFIQGQRTSLQEALLAIEQSLADATEEVQRAEKAVKAMTRPDEIVARVRITAATGGTARVSIRYLSRNSGWDPAYSVRSNPGSDTMAIEYQAMIRHQAGADWSNIDLTLSTAMPSRPSGPSEIIPVFVDRRPDSRPARKAASQALAMDEDQRNQGVFRSSGIDAAVNSAGTAVTYRLPQRVSIPSDVSSATRLRIAEFAAPTTRVLVTRPVADPGVYLRADAANNSEYVLLAGEAALFTGGEYLGSTQLKEVPAGGNFEVWFGIDPSISVVREVLGRDTERTGLLGGGRQTTTNYRIDLVNLAGKKVSVEVWDRRPVSRNEDIDIRVVDVSPALAGDQDYLETAAIRGFLKWDIELAPAGTEAASASIKWQTRVSRPKDLEITPIPE